MLAVETFISELNIFAATEYAMLFQRQSCYNFIIAFDEIAEICMYIQMSITFKTVEIKISFRV